MKTVADLYKTQRHVASVGVGDVITDPYGRPFIVAMCSPSDSVLQLVETNTGYNSGQRKAVWERERLTEQDLKDLTQSDLSGWTVRGQPIVREKPADGLKFGMRVMYGGDTYIISAPTPHLVCAICVRSGTRWNNAVNSIPTIGGISREVAKELLEYPALNITLSDWTIVEANGNP